MSPRCNGRKGSLRFCAILLSYVSICNVQVAHFQINISKSIPSQRIPRILPPIPVYNILWRHPNHYFFCGLERALATAPVHGDWARLLRARYLLLSVPECHWQFRGYSTISIFYFHRKIVLLVLFPIAHPSAHIIVSPCLNIFRFCRSQSSPTTG